MKISLITPTYNSSKTIARTLDSVVAQNYPDLEYIIIDGASKDDTLRIIEGYQSKINIKVVSESDKGLYDAMNKGVKLASGEVIGILNSDDVFFDETVLKTVANAFASDAPDIVYGDILMAYPHKKAEKWSLSNQKINSDFFIKHTLFHQATFIQKNLFDKYGFYDEKYQIVGDFDFFIKTIIKNKVSTKYLPKIISEYDTNGI
ncbi:glycosyltransferase, partial [bacterium]|nr:glycosyltransferase [bacterium]